MAEGGLLPQASMQSWCTPCLEMGEVTGDVSKSFTAAARTGRSGS